MIKKMTKHGNSMALIIDKPILELLKITEDTSLEIVTNGTSLMIQPILEKKNKAKLKKSLDKINKKYSKTLKKLA